MDTFWLARQAEEYLEMLCNRIPNRRVGSEGNQHATAFFAETMQSFGFDVECTEFECMDWQNHGAAIMAGGVRYEAHASPYAPGVEAEALLISACSVEELEQIDISQKILLMRGELAREQFLPKNFPFFQVDEQQRIIQMLERKKPLAILTATARNPELAGALYPFPVFEDGDFDIPSAYLTEEQGALLSRREGEIVSLEIDAKRLPSHGCNVVAHKGQHPNRRAVIFAHIDAKVGTPGALDNGTGIVTLLLLGELLKEHRGGTSIEIVALNGEDYYSNPGEQLYLRQNEGKFQEILLGINIDGMGYRRGKTAYSLYDCPPELTCAIQKAFTDENAFLIGEHWFQGDHALFLMNGRPALALISELLGELITEIVHTEKDIPGIVDYEKVVATALTLHRLLINLEKG